jgi:CMP-2-keto-3-deoxyoctulosonic acid synthetase
MEELAAQYNMSVEKLRAMLEGEQVRADSAERRMAAQVAVDQRKDMAAAANVAGAEGGGKSIA